jgi:hypothetical protein
MKMTTFTSLLLASLALFTSSRGVVTGQRPPDCFGDEVTIDFSNPSPTGKPLIYTLDRGVTLPPGLVLGRRTGIVTGVLRDTGFQNTYNITVIGTDPTDSTTLYDGLYRSTTLVTSMWCTGARISRFVLVTPNTNKVTRVVKDGESIHLACLGGGGGFNMEVETFTEFPREAQSEGDLTVRVDFVLDEKFVRTERSFPYALGGDVKGKYLEFPIQPGKHTLTATPYNPSGIKGFAKTISFTIIQQQGADADSATTPTHKQSPRELL